MKLMFSIMTISVYFGLILDTLKSQS